jgi:uncharacterized protein (DUF305 family)
MEHDHKHNPYKRLGLMAALSFVSMYTLMYAMVDSFGSVYNNLNQVYMAGLMAAPMIVIELRLMAGMYKNKRLNAILAAGSIMAGILFFAAIRQQTAISDRQFLRSMIPHHAGAILMCEEAPLSNPEIGALCGAIISSQRQEIAAMQRLLERDDLK